MTLSDIGYYDELNRFVPEAAQSGCEFGRVFAVHKDRCAVFRETGVCDATVSGALRYTARSAEDFPVVGDWVLLSADEGDEGGEGGESNVGSGSAVIRKVLPRKSAIRRQSAGAHADIRVIAANVDCALLMQAVDRDFSLNRLDRYLAICHESNVTPVIVMTKTDLADGNRETEIAELIGVREKGVPLVFISNETRAGYDRLDSIIVPGKTYCLLGSSGIGKSTLINNLCGKDVMKTGSISEVSDRGRHTTSSREMFMLAGGAIVIDTPGLREVGLPASEKGIGMTFGPILELAERCRFGDCTHTKEAGCAVLAALESGELDAGSYENYLKLRRESEFHSSTQAERHRKDRDFGKMRKDYLRDRERKEF